MSQYLKKRLCQRFSNAVLHEMLLKKTLHVKLKMWLLHEQNLENVLLKYNMICFGSFFGMFMLLNFSAMYSSFIWSRHLWDIQMWLSQQRCFKIFRSWCKCKPQLHIAVYLCPTSKLDASGVLSSAVGPLSVAPKDHLLPSDLDSNRKLCRSVVSPAQTQHLHLARVFYTLWFACTSQIAIDVTSVYSHK